MGAVRELLTTLRLTNYIDRFEDMGYDDLAYISELDREGFAHLGEVRAAPHPCRLRARGRCSTASSSARRRAA